MGLISKITGRSHDNAHPREHIKKIIGSDSADIESPLNRHEKALILNVLDQQNRTADDVMIQRADIAALPANISVEEALERMAREHHSRMPVYNGDLDDIIGMIHIKDLVSYDEKSRSRKLTDYLRQPLFIAPNISVLDLLLHMRQRRTHMALVIDEHGSVDGLITIEDLIETIVGDISDEHDELERPHWIEKDNGQVEIDARMKLNEFLERLGRVILTEQEQEADIDTIGGLVFWLAEKVPTRNEIIRHSSGLMFQVIDADPRHIRTLKMKYPENWNENLASTDTIEE